MSARRTRGNDRFSMTSSSSAGTLGTWGLSSMNAIGSGATETFSYLWNASAAPGSGETTAGAVEEQISSESFVLATELPDATLVRLGQARFYHESNTYRMVDGGVELPASSKTPDGKYVIPSGTYLVLTEEEFEAKQTAVPKPPVNELEALLIDTSEAPEPVAAAPVASIMDDLLLPTVAPLVPAAPVKRVVRKRAPTGCGYGELSRTVVSMGDFDGDAGRMSVALARSKEMTKFASEENGNEIHQVFLGNLAPDTYSTDAEFSDCVEEAVRRKKESPSTVHLILGARELSSLRFRERVGKSELMRMPLTKEGKRNLDLDVLATVKATLLRPTPFSEDTDVKIWDWHSHNAELEETFGDVEGEDADALFEVLAVGMYLKLESMAARTKDAGPRDARALSTSSPRISELAPGLVRVFAKRLLKTQPEDLRGAVETLCESVISPYLDAKKTMKTAFRERYTKREDDGWKLSEAGKAILPAAEMIVNTVLEYMTEGAMNDYLGLAVPIECIAPSDEVYGKGGLWAMSTGTGGPEGSIVGKCPKSASVETVDGKTHVAVEWASGEMFPLDWEKQFVEQWKTFYSKFSKGESKAEEDAVWVALSIPESAYGPASSDKEQPLFGLRPPSAQFGSAVHGVTGRVESSPFGIVRRTLAVQGKTGAIDPLSVWVTNNTEQYGPTVCWSVATWCQSTAQALNPPMPTLDLSLHVTDYQYDVSLTLSSLLTAELNGVKPFERIFADMRGLVGPRVRGGRDGTEWLRAIHWSHSSMQGGALMLLPEAYVKMMLYNYDQDLKRPADNPPTLCSQGFMVLPSDEAVPIKVPGVTLDEAEGVANSMGPRIWTLCKRGVRSCFQMDTHHEASLESMKRELPAWTSLLRYHLEAEADIKTELHPGDQVPSGPERTILYTSTSSLDGLAGLCVRWTLATAQSSLPTLDVDNELDTGVQSRFEIVK